MGFLNKLKNVFFEEEEIEVEEKPKKEKPIAKKVEIPKKEKIKVEDMSFQEEEEEEEIEAGESYTPKKKETGFKFPVLLEDDLIEEEIEVEDKPMKRERKIEEAKETLPKHFKEEQQNRDLPFDNSYTRDLNSADYSLNDRKTETKGFKPSPIISPIYGVLDKNYTKDEIHDKKETHTTTFSFTNDKLDLDSVRRKAYGDDIAMDIEKDIEEDIEEEYNEEDTTLDMTDTNMTPVVEKVTVGDAEEYFADLGLEYNVDYKDNSKEKASGKRTSRVKKTEEYEEENNVTTIEEETEEPIVDDINEEEVVDKKKRTRSKKTEEKEEIEIEDNLFDLIDSMYDEGE